MYLLMLCGEDGAGKDTIADAFLPRGHEYRMALGDRVRALIRESLPIGLRDLTEDKDRPIAHLGGLTGRAVMRLVGRMLREVDDRVWARPIVERLTDAKADGYEGIAIVTDVRDPEDMDYIAENARHFGFRVHRVRVTNAAKAPSTHPYEQLAKRCNVDSTLLVMGGNFEVAAAELEATLRGVWPEMFPPRGGE